MRDPEYLIQLLKEMSEQKNGWIQCPRAIDSNEATLNRYHHVELLVDAGHASWENTQGVARITSQGYNFLNAIEKRSNTKIKFLDLFNDGVSYIEATVRAVELVHQLRS